MNTGMKISGILCGILLGVSTINAQTLSEMLHDADSDNKANISAQEITAFEELSKIYGDDLKIEVTNLAHKVAQNQGATPGLEDAKNRYENSLVNIKTIRNTWENTKTAFLVGKTDEQIKDFNEKSKDYLDYLLGDFTTAQKNYELAQEAWTASGDKLVVVQTDLGDAKLLLTISDPVAFNAAYSGYTHGDYSQKEAMLSLITNEDDKNSFSKKLDEYKAAKTIERADYAKANEAAGEVGAKGTEATNKLNQVDAAIRNALGTYGGKENDLKTSERELQSRQAIYDAQQQQNEAAVAPIKKTVETLLSNSKSAIDQATNAIDKTVNANSSIITQRVSSLGNPNMANVKLANFIKSLEGERFADNGDMVLAAMAQDEMNEYKNSFAFKAFGAKGNFKDNSDPKIYGGLFSYDRVIDDTIVGGYLSYSKSKTKVVEVDSDTYGAGAYVRHYIGNHELGFNLGFGFGKNDISYQQQILNRYEAVEGDFDSKFVNTALSYGRIFNSGDRVTVKPYAALSYTYIRNEAYNTKAVSSNAVFQEFDKTNAKNLKARVGLEMANYGEKVDIYVNPYLEREIVKDSSSLPIRLAGSSTIIANTKGGRDKQTTIGIDFGASINVTKNLSFNIDLGVSNNTDEKLYSGAFGVKFKF
ncbi:MAG: autotransporter outer membrane beta-barrel domain-containing protein [Campylobacter sp.]|nr:autotransporter outer membrane beta-barrel domain-containing protein [Campylobacter sp.]